MTKGKDIYDIGKEDGRKEREAEIIEMINGFLEVVKYKGGLLELKEQIKENKK